MVSTREQTSRALILFRCDANERIGFGHVARCLAWAEALADEGAHVEFAGEYSEDAKTLIDAAGISRPPNEATTLEWNAVVLDGYHFADDEMLNAFKRPCRRIWVDDFGDRGTYLCDAVVNFTVGAQRLAYPGSVKNCYLGPNYFPARRPLRALRASPRERATQRTDPCCHRRVSPGKFYCTRLPGDCGTRPCPSCNSCPWIALCLEGVAGRFEKPFDSSRISKRDRFDVP